METPIDHPLTLTVEQTAKLLGIGRSTVYELVRSGDIPSLRLGRRIVVPLGQIAERLGMGCEAVRAAAAAPAEVASPTVFAEGRPKPVGATAPNDSPSLF